MRALQRLLPLAIAILLLANGCVGHIRELSPDKPFDADDKDAIVVLRVTPKAWVVLVSGKFDRYGWKSKRVPNLRQFWSEDGFVVAKVTPTEEDEGYAVVEIRPEQYSSLAHEPAFSYATALWSPKKNLLAVADQTLMACPAYAPSGETQLPVFKAVAGQVTYVGAIRIDASKEPESDDPPRKIGVARVTLPDDVEAVARFMAKHYPKVHAGVAASILQMMRMNPSPAALCAAASPRADAGRGWKWDTRKPHPPSAFSSASASSPTTLPALSLL